MGYVIKNLTDAEIKIDGVDLPPGKQYAVATVTRDMRKAEAAKKLQIKSDETTLAERKADVEAIKPFHTGDPAIDG